MKKFQIFAILAVLIMVFISQANASEPQEERTYMPVIGERAPSFEAQTTQGRIKFPDDYWNKWVVLFSHPADFTPVCTSELMKFAQLHAEFDELNCELLGLSVDGLSSHVQWIKEIQEIEYDGMKNIRVEYPIIDDTHQEVAKKFGMIHPYANNTSTIRGVFIIDPDHKVQAILMYPMMTGRNIEEILRLVKALQKTEEELVATPEGWEPGDDLFLIPELSPDKAMIRFNRQGDGYSCPAWFMCLRPDEE